MNADVVAESKGGEMTINTQRLRELAQKATPGHWYSKWPEERCTWVDVGNSRYPVAYTGDCFD